jgi:large subunit ribosomal protein L21
VVLSLQQGAPPAQEQVLTLVCFDIYNKRLWLQAIFKKRLTVAYAIIQVGSKQYRVSEGDVIRIPSIAGEEGSSVEFDVLVHGDGHSVQIGTPVLEGAQVRATIVGHGRERKIIVFKKKRRKQYKRKRGHRQGFTAVRIETIRQVAAGESAN